MATGDDEQQLEEFNVSGVNRRPGVVKRAERAPGHFATGTVLPRLQGILNPGLYRERGDTTRLVDSVLGEDGALARLAATNPDLATEIRQQADSPMTRAEHQKFRSSLLGMVGDEVKREQQTQYQLKDNQGFYQAFRQLDGFIPGIGNKEVDTREEYERRQIDTLYQQAQEAALLDPAHSAALMGEVRKKADALTDGIRTDIEKQRRVARAEDSSLWATAREKLSETTDVVAALRDDLAKKGIRREPNAALMNRALTLLGRAGDFPTAGIVDDAAGAVANVIPDESTAGNIAGEAIALATKGLKKGLESSDVAYLIDRLQFNAQQVAESYKQDRGALATKYKAAGLQFGEQPGEIYAVPNEAYEREAAKIQAAEKKPTDTTDSLRGMLSEEVESATAAVEKLKPEAAANVPGAAARLAAAQERLTTARDDHAIFEADQPQAGGVPVLATDDAATELTKARKRRAVREQARDTGLVRKAITQTLRGYTR